MLTDDMIGNKSSSKLILLISETPRTFKKSLNPNTVLQADDVNTYSVCKEYLQINDVPTKI